MNVGLIRFADKFLGTTACAIATLLRKCACVFDAPNHDASPPRSILFIKLAEQGATIIAYPAIKRAIEAVGRDNVHFLASDMNLEVLEAMNVIPRENIFPVRADLSMGFMSDILSSMRQIRARHIDAVIDLEFFARSTAFLSWATRARIRVGFHAFHGEASYRGDLMTHRMVYNPHLHTARLFRAMVEAALKNAGDLPAFDDGWGPGCQELPVFKPEEAELDAMRKTLEHESGSAQFQPLVLLNANASDLLPLRRWPAGNYVELAKRILASDPRARVAFTGVAGETKAIAELVSAVADPRCFSVAGKTSFRQLLALYCLSDLLVTNDSGPAHFAAMTPIPTITLFGPETPRIFGTETDRNRVTWKALPCSPCVNAYNDRQSPCRNNICMRRITVDEVMKMIERI